jgi:prepilin-type processing-associated H-X9-DG protein
VAGTIKLSDDRIYEREWGVTTRALISGARVSIPSLLSSFLTNKSIFECPSVPKPTSGLTYLYNDLVANESIDAIPQPGISILTADGDDHLKNVGHARAWNSEGVKAIFQTVPHSTTSTLLIGAAIGDAAVRHAGGANYGFTDGHVKWMKPEAVFFPAKTSTSRSHYDAKTAQLLGPDPAGPKANDLPYEGKRYRATFHIR